MKYLLQHPPVHRTGRRHAAAGLRALFLLAGCWLLFTAAAYAGYYDDITIRGKVVNETGAPLPNVSIQVKGGTKGTTTNNTGDYAITVSDLSILVFSYIGYDSVEQSVTGKTMINVTLTPSGGQLGDVVVVGYGTQRKRDLTGAVASVKGEELVKQPVQTATQALQGKAAGVQIISSGAPNSQPTVRIRGTGTMLAGADPLYVVDGVLTNDIRNINTADIVSVDILKDASSQAIYGLSGGNGVIIITTKQGKTGKPMVSYTGSVGTRKIARKVKLADAQQYADYQKDATPSLVIPSNPSNTDWYDAVLRTGINTNQVVSLSGGTEAVKYYFSAGYYEDQGIIIDNKYRRYSLRSNNTYSINNKLKLITQASYTNGKTNDVNLVGAYNDAYRASPVIPSKIGGRYGNTSAFQNVGNPVLDIESVSNTLYDNRLQGAFGLEYKPIRSLTLKSMFNADWYNANRKTYNYQFYQTGDTTTFLTQGGNQRNDLSQLTNRRDNNFIYTWDNTATYTKSFGKSDLTVLGGFLVYGAHNEYLTGAVKNVSPNPDLWYLYAGDPTTATNDNLATITHKISYLGRVNYAFDQKYLLTASVRYDGTSKFSTQNRYETSPSIGGAWIISREKFMDNQKLFNLLKLKASWGRVANDNIDPSLFIVTATPNIPYYFNGQILQGTAIQDIKDKNLQWETLQETDFGLEFGMLKNKLTGEFTYYKKTTKNALIKVNIPGILGDPDGQYITNAASFSNKGFEFGLNWKDNISKDFHYTVGVNGTFNTNKIDDLKDGQPLFDGAVGQQSYVTYSYQGVPIGTFYVLQSLGVFQSQDEINNYKAKDGTLIQPDAKPGQLKYADRNGDGKITPDDRFNAGSYQPKFYFGFNFGVNYKAWDLSADLYGNLGNKIYNGKKAYRYDSRDNVEADYFNKRFSANHPSTTDPITIDQNTPASTYFVESGSFLRMNNLTLGYTLSSKVLGEKFPASSIRFYLTSQNLFTITGYSGFTPELVGSTTSATTGNTSPLSAGIELNAYPTPRTFAFGVNVNFK
ncbi:SusC/RagA family TonB-linked outer membrane protein [Deminuibacter soli]|uniref:TonB-dependent receptor n=1 Tax=Deminuibacter soli TaxID=2291815 RepID=A0A3E1NPT5_9BACT|nr:TonB-dependent receptor [Deminuibacter soli]RFM29941.1 TonB-dependent receptor [Deminuibacter soli]